MCGAVWTSKVFEVVGNNIGWPSEGTFEYAIDERVPPDTNWNRIVTDIPATPPMNNYSNLFVNPTNSAAYYRVIKLGN
jgi:hypothetical protein